MISRFDAEGMQKRCGCNSCVASHKEDDLPFVRCCRHQVKLGTVCTDCIADRIEGIDPDDPARQSLNRGGHMLFVPTGTAWPEQITSEYPNPDRGGGYVEDST